MMQDNVGLVSSQVMPKAKRKGGNSLILDSKLEVNAGLLRMYCWDPAILSVYQSYSSSAVFWALPYTRLDFQNLSLS